jgi:hypothetical protein
MYRGRCDLSGIAIRQNLEMAATQGRERFQNFTDFTLKLSQLDTLPEPKHHKTMFQIEEERSAPERIQYIVDGK